jgi:hypothetical protein
MIAALLITPANDAASQQIDFDAASQRIDLESIRLDQQYSSARRTMLALGLKPAPIPRGGQFDECKLAAICQRFPEVVSCTGMGLNPCRIALVAPDGRIVVGMTSGETPEQMTLDELEWANAADTLAVQNLMAGKPERSD